MFGPNLSLVLDVPDPFTGGSTAALNWSVPHAPAAATKATAARGAVSGARHVCTGVTASIACGATAQTPLSVYLRDGVTGLGPVLWSYTLAAPANSTAGVSVAGLNVTGGVSTAMTLEFSAAGVAASVQTVTLGGYDTN